MIALLAVPLAGCPSPSAKKTPASQRAGESSRAVADRTRDALKATRSYKVKLETAMNPMALFKKAKQKGAKPQLEEMKMTCELAVALPNRMKLKVSMDNPDGDMRIQMIFDGSKVWVSQSMTVHASKAPRKDRENLMVLDQKTLAPPDEPFNVGYSVRGHGLSEGKDLVATLLGFLGQYRFSGAPGREKVADEPCLVLDGSQDLESALETLFKNRRTLGSMVMSLKSHEEMGVKNPASMGLTKMAADVLKATTRFKLWVSERDHLPRQWSLGDGKTELMRVQVLDLEQRFKHPAETFAVKPERWKEARDITAQAQEVLKKSEEALKDKKRVIQVKKDLKALLK